MASRALVIELKEKKNDEPDLDFMIKSEIINNNYSAIYNL